MATKTRATPNTMYDPSAQPKRRVAMLTISTPTNRPLHSAGPLKDLLGTRDKDGTGPSTKCEDQADSTVFDYTTLPTPPMSYTHPLVPPPSSSSRPNPHVRGASDDCGTFVSVPPSLDPFSSVHPQTTSFPFSYSAEASSGSENQPNAATTVTNQFTIAARQRQAESANRILGEYARSQAAGDDSCDGWTTTSGRGTRRWTSTYRAKIEDGRRPA